MTFEEFVERTNSAESWEDIFQALCGAVGDFGYDYVAYFLLTDHPAQGQEAGFCIEGAINAREMQIHPADSKCSRTLSSEPGFHQAHPFQWTGIGCGTPIQTKVMETDGADKLHDGMGIPIHGANGALAGLVLASCRNGKAKTDANSQSRLMALAMQFHLAYAGLKSGANNHDPVTLTPREREVLLWAAEGKSDSVISDILGITVPTVRFHLQNTFRKLNTHDRTLAVLKAMRQGLITPNFGDTAQK